MRRKFRTGDTVARGTTFGSALLCLCLSVVCSFGLGFALTAESNRALLTRQAIIEDLNILPVPGASSDEALRSVGSAVCASLFYAFSLGIGLPALLLPCLYFFRGAGTRGVVKWTLLVAVTICLGFSLNQRAVGLRESVFVLGTGCWVYIWLFRSGSKNTPELKKVVRALPGFLGAALFLVLIALNSGIRDFKAVRDAIFLSNELGRSANDLYYRYTLMAAEPIKPPAKKTQPLCLVPEACFEEQERRLLKRYLNKAGVIPVSSPLEGSEDAWDWVLKKAPPYLVVEEPGTGEEERIEMSRISSLPKVLLDGKWGASGAGLRFWIGLSLFVGIPGAVLGGAAFVLTRLVGGIARLTGRPSSIMWEAVFPLGAAVLAGFHLLAPFPGDAEDLTRMALSQRGWVRIRAVRLLGEVAGPRFNDPGVLLRLLNDGDARVRYWAATMVRGSEGKAVMNRLIAHLTDSSINVACASAHGLKRFHSPEVVRALRHIYQTRTDWYLRDAVYRSLRSHGSPHIAGDG